VVIGKNQNRNGLQGKWLLCLTENRTEECRLVFCGYLVGWENLKIV
jgi:hypothetical protein